MFNRFFPTNSANKKDESKNSDNASKAPAPPLPDTGGFFNLQPVLKPVDGGLTAPQSHAPQPYAPQSHAPQSHAPPVHPGSYGGPAVISPVPAQIPGGSLFGGMSVKNQNQPSPSPGYSTPAVPATGSLFRFVQYINLNLL